MKTAKPTTKATTRSASFIGFAKSESARTGSPESEFIRVFEASTQKYCYA